QPHHVRARPFPPADAGPAVPDPRPGGAGVRGDGATGADPALPGTLGRALGRAEHGHGSGGMSATRPPASRVTAVRVCGASGALAVATVRSVGPFAGRWREV